MTTNNTTILQLATVQKAVTELHQQVKGLCSIHDTGIQLLENAFVELMEGKGDIIEKELTYDVEGEYPFRYNANIFGTRFYCISDNPDLFPKYPVRKLAEDLVSQVSLQENPIDFVIAYADGSYIMKHKDALDNKDMLVFSFRYGFYEATDKLEKAILLFMEVEHNANK